MHCPTVHQGFPMILFGFDEVPYHTELVREMQTTARKMRGKVATIFIPTDQLEVLREFQLPPGAVPVSKGLLALVLETACTPPSTPG
jgi:hypothetical protein